MTNEPLECIVTLVEAKGLLAGDWTGKSDPYVVFQLGSDKKTSKAKFQTLNPKWNEEFTFKGNFKSTDSLALKIWDWDIFSRDENLGETTVDLSTLYKGKNEKLVDLNVGQVHLLINCVNFGKERKSTKTSMTVTVGSFDGLSTIQNKKDVVIKGPLTCSFTVDDVLYTTKASKDGIWEEAFPISSLQQEAKTLITFNLSDSTTGALIGYSQVYLDSLVLKAGEEVTLSNPLSNVSSGFFHLKIRTNFDIAPLASLDGTVPKKATAVVIGSGFAGSNVARHLYDRKVDVILLEAKDVFGGRCLSLKLKMTDKSDTSAYYVDGGCNYISLNNNYIYQFVNQDKELKPLIVDTFDMRKFTNYDVYEPLTPEEQQAYIDEYNKTHKPKISLYNRNAQQVEVFLQQKMVYDFRTQKIPGVDGVPNQWSLYEVACAGLLLTKIQLYEQVLDINDPLFKGEYYKQFQNESWFKELNQMVNDMDNQIYADWATANTKFADSAQELLIQVLDISIQAPLSIKSNECSTLFSFIYNKSNGGFQEVINDAEGGPQQYALRNSFNQVIQKIDAPLINSKRAFLNKTVKKIDYTKDSTSGTIELSDGTIIEADQIINCSGVVASQNISFTPGTITDGRNFVQTKSTMGATIKTFFAYEKPWWRVKDSPSESFSGYVGAVQNSKVFNQEYPKDPTNTTWFYDVSYQAQILDEKPVYLLMTFITDQDCVNVLKSGATEDDIKKIVLDHMRYYFKLKETDKPNPEVDNYIGFAMGEWWQETPLIQGGPDAVFKPGTYAQGDLTTKGVNPKLHFCNSEYASIDRGYMNGALCIGKQVANDVLAQMNIPQVEDTFMTTAYPYTVDGQTQLDYVLMKPTHLHWIELKVLDELMVIFGKIAGWIEDGIAAVKKLIEIIKKLIGERGLKDKNGPLSKLVIFLETLTNEDGHGHNFHTIKKHFK
eukprot:gene12602-6422_t